MNTSIDVQLHYGGKWLPGELVMGQDGVPRVLVAGETGGRDPGGAFYLRSDGETDEGLLKAAGQAGFNVLGGLKLGSFMVHDGRLSAD